MRSLVLVVALAACTPAPVAPPPAVPARTAPKAAALTPEQAERAACSAGEDALAPAAGSLDTGVEVAGRASSVEIAGTKRLERARVQGVLETRAGSELSSELLRADATRVFELGGVEDVRIELAPSATGSRVRFVVVEQPELAHVFVHAPQELSPARDGLPKAGSAYDGAMTARALDVLRQSLATSGYLRASTSVRGRRLDDGRVDLCLTIEPGAKILVQTVDVQGASAIGAPELLALRETRDGTANVQGAVLDEELLELDTLRMNALYYDRGMIQAKLSHESTIGEGGVKIVFRVEEGPVFHLAGVRVDGDLVGTKAAYLHLIQSKKGEVFSRAHLLADIERINAMHREQRRPDVEVQPETEIDTAKLEVNVTLRLHGSTAKP